MSGYLLDTHIWLWYLIGSDRLPAALRQEIDSSPKTCRLSPICVWELGMLAEKGRVNLDAPFRKWFDRAMEQLPLKEAPLNFAVALKSRQFTLPHRDPADRFLAATTLVYDLTLLTVDARLIAAEWLPTSDGE